MCGASVFPFALLGQLSRGLQVFVDELVLNGGQTGLISAVVHGVLAFTLNTHTHRHVNMKLRSQQSGLVQLIVHFTGNYCNLKKDYKDSCLVLSHIITFTDESLILECYLGAGAQLCRVSKHVIQRDLEQKTPGPHTLAVYYDHNNM